MEPTLNIDQPLSTKLVTSVLEPAADVQLTSA